MGELGMYTRCKTNTGSWMAECPAGAAAGTLRRERDTVLARRQRNGAALRATGLLNDATFAQEYHC